METGAVSDNISIPTYRVPRHRGFDPGTRRLALIAAGLGGGLLLLSGAWSMLGHRASHGVPVVHADTSPVRVKPTDPGGLKIAGAGNEIFSGGSDTTVDRLAPPPEVPDPQALRAPPPPVVTAPPDTAPPTATPSPVAATAMPAPTTPATTAPATTPRTVTPPKPPVAVAMAAATPAAKPSNPTATPAAAAVAATRPAAISSPAAAPVRAATGWQVQLAAVSSEPAARSEWERLAKRMPDVFAGHRPSFSQVAVDGHTLWRIRTGGFHDTTEASTFCAHVRAKGGTCSVADY